MARRMSRRLWARRGRSLADFTIGVVIATIQHLLLALISAYGHTMRRIGKVVQRYQAGVNRKVVSKSACVGALSATVPSDKTETERDAVEVLVSLGLPRPASEKRVARIVDMHGILPIEELLRKALG